MPYELILLIVIAAAILITIMGVLKRYKRCPSDKIMVIYGKVGKSKEGYLRSSRCIHGGASFVWPIFQAYQFLDLTPISIEVNLKNALSKQNIRIDVPSRFTVGISTETVIMYNAAERLLGLNYDEIQELAKDIIFGQLRLIIATMDIEEINTDRDKFLANVSSNVETELNKIGLKLINVNVTDIRDESGYIESLGKEAAAKAVNDAKKSVAEHNRDGSIGEANAQQDQRVQVAKAEATAVDGENTAKISIAKSESNRRQRIAEAEREASATEKVQAAMALKEAYAAQEEAERSRAEKEEATQHANIIIPAEIDKNKVEIRAEAEAERLRRIAKGEADGKLAKMQAEAQGILETLSKQAEGYRNIVNAANGNAKDAVTLMIADKIKDLVKTQVEAIKGIKIDKVTVWDSMGGNGTNGKSTSTANFLSGLMKSVPPLEDLFNMAGMELPDYLKGKNKTKQDKENTEEEIKIVKDIEKKNKGNE
ncbi:MAG: flotillin family protein [Spirochaetota bacterium]